MNIRWRIFLGYFLVLALGFGVLMRWVVQDARLQPKKATEESLVETSRLLASLLETGLDPNGMIQPGHLAQIMERTLQRRFAAQIYEVEKNRVGLRVYVTDHRGTVIYDSDQGRDLGADYSGWNDVYNTLRGRYGARATRGNPDDPDTSVMVVSAPVMAGERIVGVVGVAKPYASLAGLVRGNARRLLLVFGLVFLVVLGASYLVARWISGPIRKLTDHAKAVRDGRREPLPRLGGVEVAELGHAFADMRAALEGKRYVEQYVETLTHELKSPLSGIQASVELLEEDPELAQRHRFLHNIRRETDRMRTVVQRLLRLSELENRPAIEEPEPVDLATVVSEILSDTQPEAVRRDICFAGDRTAGPVQGDRFLIGQAIRNIVDNALTASPAGSTIAVHVGKTRDRMRVSVCDKGPGIPEYARDRVWERFYSLPTTEGGWKGTGLGLPFVREVMALHGGWAELYFPETGGTCCALIFPFP